VGFYLRSDDEPQREKPLRATKHSITVDKRTVSISLEPPFWEGFRDIARLKGMTHAQLLGAIMAEHGARNLSSAVRVFVLAHFRARAAEAGQVIG
jgi:predicted DNA-binding ribbon-helix-helix protein